MYPYPLQCRVSLHSHESQTCTGQELTSEIQELVKSYKYKHYKKGGQFDQVGGHRHR